MNDFARRIIVALDTDRSNALSLADELRDQISWVKVGMTLFYQTGPEIVRELRDRGLEVFVDLKLHDIPHQVEGAARQLGHLGAQMMTVHASGGTEMIEAAVRGAEKGAAEAGLVAPAVIAVTVLTSTDDAGLREIGIHRSAADQVALLGEVVSTSSAAGVVCSPQEARAMRALLGEKALVVTPGVRPAWSAAGDQSRVTTPAQALSSGASHLVIGRPITDAASARDAVRRIIEEAVFSDAPSSSEL